MHSRISHHTSQVPRDMFKHVANFCGQFLCEFHVFSVGNTMDIVVNIESQVEFSGLGHVTSNETVARSLQC